MERTQYSEAEQFDSVTSLEAHPNAKKKKNKSKNNRRFSDEQIRLLETIFEADSKLEPRKKVQLARELGLQPRQVAIWFQNRRARWKSKQIEQDFGTLRADYDKLASRFESLKEEKQSLLNQLQKLNDLLGQHHDGNMDRIGFEGNNDVSGSSNKDHGNCETGEVKPSFLQEDELKHREHRGVVQSHKNTSADVGDYGDEGHELLIMGHVDASVSPEDWHRFDSGSLHWLNFWT